MEPPEPTPQQPLPMPGAERRDTRMFAALRVRAFARFWSAAAVSNIGNWMQTITVPYVIYRLTDSRTWLGVTALATFLPSIIGTVISTGIVDRFERRRMLLTLQLTQVGIAVAMWLVWVTGSAHVATFLVLTAASGLTGGMTTPVWNSFVPLLVPREVMPSAIRLNALQFALARAIGPAIAGAVLGPWGPGVTFAINAASFGSVISVLLTLSASSTPTGARTTATRQVIDGWRYLLARQNLLISPITMFVCGFFGSSVVQLAAAIADEQFHKGRGSIGTIVSSFGIGSIGGSLLITAFGDRVRRSTVTYWGLGSWIIGSAVLAATSKLAVGVVGLFFMGLAHVVTATSVNTALQLQVDDEFRGRAIAAHMQGILTGVAIGAFALAKLADWVEIRGSFVISSLAIGLFTVFATIKFDRLRLLDTDATANP